MRAKLNRFGCPRGQRPVAFPLVYRLLRFTDREAAAANVEDVPVSSLVATQKCVDGRWVREGVDRDRSDLGHPLVIRSKGRHYIQDGHHRCEVARLRGDETIRVRVVDRDLLGGELFWR